METYNGAYTVDHLPSIENIPLTLPPIDLLDDAIKQTFCDDLAIYDSSSHEGADSLSDIDLAEASTWVSPSESVLDDYNVKPTEIVNCDSAAVKQDPEPVLPACAMVATAIPTTPVSSRPPNLCLNNYDSPGFDSRFNDSLTGLLGSPPPDSPLAKNPFFGDLQAILVRDCREDMLPQSLLMSMTTGPQADVFTREQDLHARFTKLEQRFPQDIKQLSSFYRYQAALIETERFRSLHSQSYVPEYKQSLNLHYDQQLHQIMDRVEQSVTLLEESERDISKHRALKPRPLLSKKAVKIMEDWYEKHLEHPYPNAVVIEEISEAGNINVEQVKKWFANKRNRSNNTRTLTEIAKRKRQLSLKC